MDYQYSDEFENLLKEIKTCENLDLLVENNLDKVFYEVEKSEWIKKLIMSAYIKYSIGKDDEAQILYGITKDEKVLEELFRNILKRSIYEYLSVIKYDKSVETFGLTHEEIEGNIKYIEDRWVHYV